VLDSRGGVKAVLSSTCRPLGIDPPGADPGTRTVPLAAGDLVCLLTDSFPESLSPGRIMFGKEGVLRVLRRHAHEAPRKILEALVRAARDFSAGVQLDDRTGVIVKVGPVP
jgi:serine phosphatase RsbU (regulator of sigma subunit)